MHRYKHRLKEYLIPLIVRMADMQVQNLLGQSECRKHLEFTKGYDLITFVFPNLIQCQEI